MNTVLLRTFLEVVDAGNLNRAAARLNVTQSTVTTRLDALESELGHRLLERNKAGAELTAEGFKFQRYAQMMLQLWQVAQNDIALPRGFSGVCNMGCEAALWQGLVSPWVARARQARPEIALSCWPGSAEDLARWLTSGLIDVALSYSSRPDGQIAVEAIGEDRFVLVASSPRGLMDWDPAYVYVDLGEQFRRQHAAAYPVEETAAVTFGAPEWALDFLLRNGGSGYLPLRMARQAIAEERLFPVPDAPVFTRPLYLARHAVRTAAWDWLDDWAAELGALIAVKEAE